MLKFVYPVTYRQKNKSHFIIQHIYIGKTMCSFFIGNCLITVPFLDFFFLKLKGLIIVLTTDFQASEGVKCNLLWFRVVIWN